jgi:exodeoxyribonuclease V alpha subunit
MEELQGIITGVLFRNEDNGFTVLRLGGENNAPPRVCVGTMPALEPGISVLLRGEWDLHRSFGRQFNVSSYEISTPRTIDAISMFLGSGFISSIGPGRARSIIDVFGLETLEVLDREPQRLLEVRGIGKKLCGRIIESWRHQRAVRELMLYLQPFGVSVNMAYKIFKAYGHEAKERITRDPYCLIDDIWGVGFRKADAIAQHLGFSQDSHRRVRAGILFVLQEAVEEGHSYLPRAELAEQAARILGVEVERVADSLEHLLAHRQLAAEEDRLYLRFLFDAENEVARMLGLRARAPGAPAAETVDTIRKWLDEYRVSTGWQGAPAQIEAVVSALTNAVFILTGGPGTGKTTTLQVIVSYLRARNRTVKLAAPTGRAAQRMGTIAGLQAHTIHRLLEFKPAKDGFFFARNADNPVEADVVIVDEVSMIDILLMKNFLAALRPETALILVGDNNQLPSVGPGYVLGDLIASRIITHVHLTTIFRQAARSRIVLGAHEVLKGNTPYFPNDKSDDCFFVQEEDPQRCVETITELASHRIPQRYGFNPIADIQVLSPMHKGILGTENLNLHLQNALNPGTEKIVRGAVSFAEGDRVMQLRNNYDTGVFNGDIGRVVSIGGEDGLRVDFDGHAVEYGRKDLDELTPAYCISIHKSQGCEFTCCIIPVVTQHYIMLQRNLLYTALTRARRLCILIGTHKALSIMVSNNEVRFRYSGLARKLFRE